jgi:hypothetical protein
MDVILSMPSVILQCNNTYCGEDSIYGYFMNEDEKRGRVASKRIKIRHIFRIFQHVHMTLLL